MSGWAIGFGIGTAVVLIVVVLLLLLITGARRIAEKAESILSALEDAKVNTLGLWQVAETNATAERIVAAATSARTALETKRGGV